MKDYLTWAVEGSNKEHTIPDEAVVTVSGKNGEVVVWVDDYGVVHVTDTRDDIK